jgi:uncharacterized membrane protein
MNLLFENKIWIRLLIWCVFGVFFCVIVCGYGKDSIKYRLAGDYFWLFIFVSGPLVWIFTFLFYLYVKIVEFSEWLEDSSIRKSAAKKSKPERNLKK